MVLALGACDKEGTEDDLAIEPALAPSGTDAAAAPAAQAPATSDAPAAASVARPTEVAADAITVGTALQGGKVVQSSQTPITTADTVYASAAVGGKPAGTEITVYWSYQDGMSHKMETKRLAAGAQDVQFSFAQADGMKAGKYNVQIDADMTPIGIVDFQVR